MLTCPPQLKMCCCTTPVQADRTRAIYELAIQQPVLDMLEALWKVRNGGLGHRAAG